jgi:predicted DNA-binding transcriptional regulator YafY
MLATHAVVTRETFLDELEVSWATLKRDLGYLRERLNAPIIYDAEVGGYRFATPECEGPRYELPGLWFNADEAHALLGLHHLLSELEPSLLSPHVAPLLSRLEAIVSDTGTSFEELTQRIRLVRSGARRRRVEFFGAVARAVLSRRRLRIRHYHRESGTISDRVISPQRLTFYRGNWYIEAWCHTREGLRSFSLDALRALEVSKETALEISDPELDAEFTNAYGIYGGTAEHVAVLRFSPAAARWVADEEWHPEQRGQFDREGYYRLEVPYSRPNELLMDVLRHSHHVEVLEPPELRATVLAKLKKAIQNYQRTPAEP